MLDGISVDSAERLGKGQPPPTIFAKAITTPPALPWDQASAAELEARRAAPLPMAGLTLRLKRLEPWRPRLDGKYAALYIRTDQIGAGFVGSARVGDRTVVADFRPPGETLARAKQTGFVLITAAIAAVLTITGISAALASRHSTRDDLIQLSRLATLRLNRAQVAGLSKRQGAALASVQERGTALSDALADLAKASASRKPDVRLESFHWRPIAYGVAVRGDGVPFASNVAKRVDQPLRPDVWVWVIPRANALPASSPPAERH